MDASIQAAAVDGREERRMNDMGWWYYAFAVFLGLSVVEAVVIIKQHIELRDYKAIVLGLFKRLDGDPDGE